MDQLAPLEGRFVADSSIWMDTNRTLVAIADNDMTNRGRCFSIQADTLLIVKTDVKQRHATPAYSNIDMPLASIVLTYVNVSDRAPRRPQGGQLAFQYQA